MNFMPSYIVAVFILVLVSSCNKSIPDDQSFTISEYRSLGMPDHDKIWTQTDYMDAFIALNKVKIRKPKSLPRKKSGKSGAYFQRMLSEENFSFLEVDTMSLSDKAYEIQNYSNIQAELLRYYTDMFNTDQYYRAELIDIYIFGLDVSQKKLDLADKIMKSDDAQDKSLQYGLYSVQIGYMELVLYILENHTGSIASDNKDLERLSNALIASISSNRKWMKPADGDKILKKLQSITSDISSQEVRKNYQNLIDTW